MSITFTKAKTSSWRENHAYHVLDTERGLYLGKVTSVADHTRKGNGWTAKVGHEWVGYFDTRREAVEALLKRHEG